MQRSLLFVPGNRPDRFEKACESSADLVCIDLEDAVAPDDKAAARTTVIEYLAGTDHKHVSVRINAADTPFYRDEAGIELPYVMMPKVGTLGDIKSLAKALPDKSGPIFALIESAKGLVSCEEILSHERVEYAIYGAIDYAGDVGCGPEWENHLYARSRLVAACAAFDVTLFDTPYIDVHDNEGLHGRWASLRARLFIRRKSGLSMRRLPRQLTRPSMPDEWLRLMKHLTAMLRFWTES